ncbi:CG0192-related protein [Aeromicrobium chenweiae]|uniref:Uncharacterized protein n=1 Tax=Aeromicrobium chenweiae TaxID=2079793 RepID=A0A2S0WRK4_9ACTN|nr:hypothetical protein [Aeromicrobium chenweiae]AWB93930.1 hypothetical protein C3E78_17900 [Aeromicrobium chenweiae]TGN30977.1 hypothetical protein E4L97_15315 [Aeromicrobium chenweiae]
MALLHAADARPTKIELIRAWVPTQPWFDGDDQLEPLGAYRFDDPDGEVGIETHLVCAGGEGPLLQVPLTYRAEPLAGAEEFLVGTLEHSMLGKRWVYDACGDPVYAAAIVETILTGGTQAELERQLPDGSLEPVEPSVRVTGGGSSAEIEPVGLVDVRDADGSTIIVTSVAEVEVLRVVGGAWAMGGETLTGTWAGHDEPVLLAVAR